MQTYADIALAAEAADFDLTVGAAEIVEADIDSDDEEFRQMLEEAQKEEEERNSFFMTNVEKSVNVRVEATTESTPAGKLYKDCGGKILERKEGWTKIQSGELEGWVSNEFLLFGDEAWELADEVGETTATVLTQALRVRKEPSEEAGVYGLLEINTEYTVIEELDEWVKIKYKSKEGYIFKGWYLNGDLFDFNTPITDSIVLEAKYSVDYKYLVLIIVLLLVSLLFKKRKKGRK